MKKVFILLGFAFLLHSCSKEEQKALQSATITLVTLQQYPIQNNGAEWDTFSAFPDPYFTFIKGNSSQSDFQSSVLDDAGQGVAMWQTYLVLFADQSALFTFYDEDGANDDLMGSVYVDTDMMKNEGYPDHIILENNGCRIDLAVEYIFR